MEITRKNGNCGWCVVLSSASGMLGVITCDTEERAIELVEFDGVHAVYDRALALPAEMLERWRAERH